MNICGVGLKNGFVKDGDITASSVNSNRFLPHYGRLDRVGSNTAYGGWLADTRTGYCFIKFVALQHCSDTSYKFHN